MLQQLKQAQITFRSSRVINLALGPRADYQESRLMPVVASPVS